MPKFQFCPQCASPLVEKIVDNESRIACSNCNFVHYNNPTPVVAAIVEYGTEVLLARNKMWPPNWFGLITGFLEAGESPEEGIIREVKEELNLEGEVVELVGIYPFFRMNQIIIAYHVKARGEIRLNEELDEYKLYAPESVRPWGSGTGDAVKDWLAKRGIFNEPIKF